MSLAEIEQQVLELPEEERRAFASWFYQNESRILPQAPENDEVPDALQKEMLLRKQEYYDHPERFRRIKNKKELKQYFAEIMDEVRGRVSSTH